MQSANALREILRSMPCTQTSAIMVRKAYGRPLAGFLTCNKTSINFEVLEEGRSKRQCTSGLSRTLRSNNVSVLESFVYLFFPLKKGNQMRNLNAEELKQVYGGHGGSGSGSKSNGSKSGSKSNGSKSGSKSKGSKSK